MLRHPNPRPKRRRRLYEQTPMESGSRSGATSEVRVGRVVMDLPGCLVRETGPADRATILDIVERYQKRSRRHARGRYPSQTTTTDPSE